VDSAAEIAARVATGDVAATDVVAGALERMGASELNAFTASDPLALDRATAIDGAIAAGASVGPLAGVPIAVKDLIDHEGRVNTRGSSIAREPSTNTATCVARLEDAGAIVVGRTGLHEYAFGFSSENQWFGPVRNPWDTTLSPGGSSGGSGAAVAAGIVPVALGTDTGGSVRVPAALCGVVGLKVTHGRIPIDGVFPLAPSIDTVGPLARTVDDAALLYAVMAGPAVDDPWSIAEPLRPPRTLRLEDVRFGFLVPWTSSPLDPDVETAWNTVIDALRAEGAAVHAMESHVDLTGHMLASFGYEVAHVHRTRFAERPETYGDEVAERIRLALATTFDDYLAALAWRRRLTQGFRQALDEVDVLLTPTVASTRKTIGNDTISIGDVTEPYRLSLSRFTAPVNHAGIPALALPLPGPGAPPPGLQLIGPAWSEARLIAIGRAMERRGLVFTGVPPHA
jgi:Asp-tRNA(Asn)/Glu-tRNA(Gln) amidotransferase A subunit family amidase